MSLNVSGYNISDIYVGNNKIDSIFVGEDLVYSGKKITPLCFASENPSVVSTIEFEAVEYSSNATTSSTAHPVTIAALDASKYSNYAAPSWVYSYDLDNWNNYTLGTAISIGDNYPSEVYFKCTANYDASVNTFVTSYLDAENNKVYWSAMHCVMTGGNICASGSINSLIYVDYEDEDNNNNAFSHIFACMFKGCQQLITPPELPATIVQNHSYFEMFYGCNHLTTAPELPATVFGSAIAPAEFCYDSMFALTAITTAPELPATTLAKACYYMMFRYSTITTAPELPATQLTDYCYYYMFDSCATMTTALSELPATTLPQYCYSNMFHGTSITTPPELPAITLVSTYCCSSMFQGCTALTTAPELPATTLAPYCYNSMFRNCTSLTTPPELPATTLASNCYAYMFDGCTSLDAIPELPATTLADYCYQSMFANDAVRASGGIGDPCTYMYRIPTAGTGSGGTKSLSTMFTSASGDSTYSPTINSVLYVNKPVLYLEE